MATAIIIGGGAAGFFAALHVAEWCPHARVLMLEASGKLLSKVRISGGGRCNVTHHCYQPQQLVSHYPRGERELLGPFHRFGPEDMVAWLADRGVTCKVEADGRMFPDTDNSATIVDCLYRSAIDAGVEVRTLAAVKGLERQGDGYVVTLAQETLTADVVLLATGGSTHGHQLAVQCGHKLVDAIPSLFTFKVADTWVHDLSGLSVEQAQVQVAVPGQAIETHGPVLCTHWGLSGPAILRASAWGARRLHQCGYACDFTINWAPGCDWDAWIQQNRQQSGRSAIANTPIPGMPKRLWQGLLKRAGVAEQQRWADVPAQTVLALHQQVQACPFTLIGTTRFKEEFVTAGGIPLDELNWKTMESKCSPGLFAAGECIDVDGITGGFNFQNAWTTARIAAEGMVEKLYASY